ncbi:thioredoxin domain-containing protein [Streptomyces sp. LP05-1]|uniref:Thioredoxin domain-containing protein n=1 Tax=Streptomyces pyxinae TaxID=2970734 RepID=A0ABT2C9T4_9ACTN|nr:thioredoxin domain-containing protein [Streptomyces sp. LP05-1]MCS0634160.1 thioredoxin domain-containing protein [Streptomyces sp. LP05-1]
MSTTRLDVTGAVHAPAVSDATDTAGVIEVTDANFGTEVLAAGRPVLVQFTAAWCSPCRQLAPVLRALAAEERERLKVVRLDVDANPETTLRHRVLATPTLLLFRAGEPVRSMVGARSGRRLREELADVLD